MGKTENCINMLMFLFVRGTAKISEIADHLEINPRNIIEYKLVLENAGYIIDSKRGSDGGYTLNTSNMFPTLKLNAEEKDTFINGCQYLFNRTDFLMYDEFSRIMEKIAPFLGLDFNKYKLSVFNRFPLRIEQKKLVDIYYTCRHCQEKKIKLWIKYENVHNEISERSIDCYKLYVYNDEWFVLAYDERSSDIRYFKLNRIYEYKILNKDFFIRKWYNESDYLNAQGMRKNGEWFKITLMLTGDSASRARERKYSEDQIIEEIERDKIKITFTMQNKDIIPRFVMGFGNDCEVISPEWLKNDIVTICKKIQEKYN